MKWERKSDNYLISKLEVGARLLTCMNAMQRKLSVYPNLKQVRHGATLGYVLEEGEQGSRFYSIELDKTRASISIYSKTTPLYFLDEAIMRFLSVMQVISKDYDISLAGLYPYLAIALSWQRVGCAFKEDAPIRPDNSDIILSKRIIGLTKENRRLNEMHNAVLNKNRRLLHRLIILESANNQSIEAISKIVNVERDDIESALRDINESGYKAIRLSADRFSLVRL